MSFSKYMMKKPVAQIQAESQKGELKRTLSAANLTSLGVGAIIGAGIFVMTGQAAAQYAGPAIILSFVLAGLCCAFAALCYAELASMLPVSGSAYSYAYASLGELFAWIMGWLLLLEYGIAASTVAVGWSGYIVSFLKDFGIMISPIWAAAPGLPVTLADGTAATGVFNLPAFLAALAVSALLVIGIKESATVNNVIVVIKVSVIVLFIAVGLFYVNADNWSPFIPEPTGKPGEFGYDGILRAAGVIFFAYVGFEAVSTAAQEAKNPQRDMPIGIIASLTICTILYMLVALVLTGIVPYTMLNVPDPIAVGVDAIGLGWLAFIVKIGAITGLSSVMLVLLYGQTRIFYTMSRDGLLPAAFSKVHPKFQTPYINTLVVGVVVAVIAGMTPISQLGDLVSMGTLLAFSIICFSVLYLRKTEPDMHRPFRVPFSPVVPILGILCCGYLMYGLREMFWTLKFYFLAGLVVYFAYGQFHSKLRNPEKR
ncbi:MAG: amino acid permease [Rickettsiales bacterium]|jgi:APA family basic amino acid/polyamine antiporter|nr:amino acid permease [Rickettsiales bacterium]